MCEKGSGLFYTIIVKRIFEDLARISPQLTRVTRRFEVLFAARLCGDELLLRHRDVIDLDAADAARVTLPPDFDVV